MERWERCRLLTACSNARKIAERHCRQVEFSIWNNPYISGSIPVGARIVR